MLDEILYEILCWMKYCMKYYVGWNIMLDEILYEIKYVGWNIMLDEIFYEIFYEIK
jgi:hypothetical protein